MKTSFAVVSALVAGIGIGGFGVNSIHAQAKPPVYMIEDNTVRDPKDLRRSSLRSRGRVLEFTADDISGEAAGCQLTVSRRRDVSSWFNGTLWSK